MKIQNWIAISALLGSISLTEEVNALQNLNDDDLTDVVQADEQDSSDDEESSDEDIQQTIDLLQAEVQDLDALAQKADKKSKKIQKGPKTFGPKKTKPLTKGQKAILKQKKLEKKLKKLAKQAKKASDTDKLIIQAKQNALIKKQKLAAKKAAVAKFKADKLAASKAQKKKLLEWKKAKVFGLPVPELPNILKKQVVPKALPPNKKREAKKDEIEKKADALIRKLNSEAEAKQEAVKEAQRKAAEEAATYRLARANQERSERIQKEEGTSPHTSDEIWAYNMPEGILKGYFQVGSQALLETADDDDDYEDVDSSDSDDE